MVENETAAAQGERARAVLEEAEAGGEMPIATC